MTFLSKYETCWKEMKKLSMFENQYKLRKYIFGKVQNELVITVKYISGCTIGFIYFVVTSFIWLNKIHFYSFIFLTILILIFFCICATYPLFFFKLIIGGGKELLGDDMKVVLGSSVEVGFIDSELQLKPKLSSLFTPSITLVLWVDVW